MAEWSAQLSDNGGLHCEEQALADVNMLWSVYPAVFPSP
jgi:hypothetical protein